MKNIIAISAGVIAVLLVIVAFVSPASASLSIRTFTPTGGIVTYEGTFEDEPEDEPAASILSIYGGEEIAFISATNGSVPVIVSGPYTKGGEKYSGEPFKKETLDSEEEWDSEGKSTKGYFKVEDAYGDGGWFEVIKHSFTTELVGDCKKVRECKRFCVKVQGNEKEQGVMMLTIEDNEGYSITNANGTDIFEILITYNEKGFASFADTSVVGLAITEKGELLFDTSMLDMEEGVYEIVLEDFATEAEDSEEIEVEPRFLEVACSDTVVLGDEIVLTITSSFYGEEVNLTVEGIPEYEGRQHIILDDDGKKKVKIPTDSMDYGRYGITIDVCGMKETVYVELTKGSVIAQAPDNATVGDVVPIEGQSDFGEFAVFIVDDIFKGETRISDGTFAWEWNTAGEFEGRQKIEVFIVDEQTSFAVGDPVSDLWQGSMGRDAYVDLILLLPTLSMWAPGSVAEGDEVLIRGTATGIDHVYLIVIDSSGEVRYPPTDIARTTNVIENSWSTSIYDLDTDKYSALVLHTGQDGETAAIVNGRWDVGNDGKTLEQRLDLLESVLNAAGSDDLYELLSFSVSAPFVQLDIPEMVELGDEILVQGSTNVQDGEKALLSLIDTSNVITKMFVLVENGSLQASVTTNGLQPGAYTVNVDVSGRASDEQPVLLVEQKESENQETERTATSTATPTPLSTDSVPKPGSTEKARAKADEIDERQGNEKVFEMPVIACDVLAALLMAVMISIRARRLR